MLIRRFHHQILSKDSLLRPHLRSWDERYQDVLNQVNLHKLHCGTGGDRRASSSNEPGEGGVADGGCGDGGDDYGNDDDDGGVMIAGTMMMTGLMATGVMATVTEGGIRAFAAQYANLRLRLGE